MESISMFGFRVIEAPLMREPKIKVRADVPMTPAGRAAMNAWLLERFGDQEVAYMFDRNALSAYFDREIDKSLSSSLGARADTLVCSSLTISKLRAACKLVKP